jgi:ABC-type dipeptide/oligopeptide/nickel transport system ATPase component
MDKETIIQTLKNQYPREIRKQLVKTIQQEDKDAKPTYTIINQIFSYVLKESNWDMPSNSKEWDTSPLEIMSEVFPKIETTKWYQEQLMMTKQNINLINSEK